MKKIVVFGGGTGLSQILKGLKLFPLDITAVVSVADNGKSTGQLREDFDIPAVGDISKVLLSMADIDEDYESLMNYRFKDDSSIGSHSIKNLVLTALIDIKNDFDHAIPVFSELFNIKGKVLPLTEDSVHLIGKTNDGVEIIGEEAITKSKKKLKKIYYNKDFTVNPKVFKAITNANLIVFSPGSLYTSLLPNLIAPGVASAIRKSKAKKIYVCNLVTQPGETTDFSVGDHLKILNKYLGKKGMDAVIVNDTKISKDLLKKYATAEQKLPVVFDKKILVEMDIAILRDKTYMIEDGYIRHDYLKTAYLIFSYLMDGK